MMSTAYFASTKMKKVQIEAQRMKFLCDKMFAINEIWGKHGILNIIK